MQSKKGERLIYFKDLVFTVLWKWKVVVAVGIILALALGGFQALRMMQTSKGEVSADLMTEYENRKEDIEERVAILQQHLDGQNNYLAQSLLMQLDPYHHYEVKVSLYARTDCDGTTENGFQMLNPALTVLRGYEKALLDTESTKAIAQVLGIQEMYVPELSIVEMDEISGTLSLRMKCEDLESGEKLLTALVTQVRNAQKNIASSVKEHTLSILEQTVVPCVDVKLAETQKKNNAALTDVQKDLTEAKKELAALGTVEVIGGISVKKVVLFAFIGGALGVILCACAIWVNYIVGTKVYSRRILQDVTGVRVLGSVMKKPHKCGIDRWLYSLEGREKSQSYDLLATDIRCRMVGKTLLITGDGDTAALYEALTKALPDVQILDCGDILSQASAVTALSSSDAVVLVEHCGVSRYNRVNDRISLIADYGKQLIGCVLLDG